MSGFVFFIGDHVISCGSKKQACVSQSTMEAEYLALAKNYAGNVVVDQVANSHALGGVETDVVD